MHVPLDGRGLGRRDIREEMVDGPVGCTGGLPDCLRDVLPRSSAERAGYLEKAGHLRTYYTDHVIHTVRLRRIGHDMIKNVGKSESCMVSQLPILLLISQYCSFSVGLSCHAYVDSSAMAWSVTLKTSAHCD